MDCENNSNNLALRMHIYGLQSGDISDFAPTVMTNCGLFVGVPPPSLLAPPPPPPSSQPPTSSTGYPWQQQQPPMQGL